MKGSLSRQPISNLASLSIQRWEFIEEKSKILKFTFFLVEILVSFFLFFLVKCLFSFFFSWSRACFLSFFLDRYFFCFFLGRFLGRKRGFLFSYLLDFFHKLPPLFLDTKLPLQVTLLARKLGKGMDAL